MGLFGKRKQQPAPDVLTVPDPLILIEAWRSIIIGGSKSWVLFQNGTCVILMEPQADLKAQAIELLREWGPVRPGSSAGDFGITTLTDHPGWVVTCHHNDIIAYVAPNELSSEMAQDLAVGILGRRKRHEDSTALDVIHIEDKRPVA